MLKHKFFYPALLALAGVVVFIDNPILHYPFSAWKEPWEVLVHVLVTVLLYVALSTRLSLLTAFVTALLFGIYPGHALTLAGGRQDWRAIAFYAATLVSSIACSFGFERFYAFLRTQEKLVRVLFMVGIGALVLGMALISMQSNIVWKDEASLWRWRAEHDPSPVSLNMWARLLYQKSGQTGEAMDIYKKVLQLDPRNRDAYFALGEIYQDLGKPEEVIGTYNKLLKLYPEDEGVQLRIIDAYGRAIQKHPDRIFQEKREDLLSQYEQLSKRKQYTANDYFNLGFLYEQVGGYEEAMRFYRKALALAPNHEKALYSLASRYQATGDVKTAMALYQRLVHFHPQSTLAYLNMGLIYNALGDTDRAKYLYQKVVNIDPNNADAYFNLGYLNESAGEIRDALNFYEKAVESNPRHAEAYYNMGNVYAALQQYPEAMASYLKTVAINPSHQNAFVNLSILSFKSKDFDGAIRYLEEARILGYNPPEAYLKSLEPYRKK